MPLNKSQKKKLTWNWQKQDGQGGDYESLDTSPGRPNPPGELDHGSGELHDSRPRPVGLLVEIFLLGEQHHSTRHKIPNVTGRGWWWWSAELSIHNNIYINVLMSKKKNTNFYKARNLRNSAHKLFTTVFFILRFKIQFLYAAKHTLIYLFICVNTRFFFFLRRHNFLFIILT